MTFWQSLPLLIDPIAFAIGSFSLRWYAICFLFGFSIVWVVLSYRARKSVGLCKTACLADLAPLLFLGVLLGGRVGYVLFYDFSLFHDPFLLISPFDPITGAYVGVRGMSFFGALLGVGATLLLFARSRGLRFLYLSDMIVPVIPIAIFFGRIGNFLNGELYGRVTDMSWGMHFPLAPDGGTLLRHPSQFYEAGLEGIALFLILIFVSRRRTGEGTPTSVFLLSYAALRFLAERFRQPDSGAWLSVGTLTEGQVFSVVLFVGVSSWILLRRWYDRSSARYVNIPLRRKI